MNYRVEVVEDAETGYFVTSDSNIPGLVAEAPTYDELVDKVGLVAAFLLDELEPRTSRRSTPLEIDFSLQQAAGEKHEHRSFNR